MGVEFNEDNNFGRRDFAGQKTPKLAAWLISKGIVKSESSANTLQVVVALAFFAIAIFLFLR